MKVVILAGGLGTRLAEETEIRPKPMVEVGGRPILWHILKHYDFYSHQDFVIALGYKGEVIKRYFLEYARLNHDFSIEVGSGTVIRRDVAQENWRVHLVDTGQETMTGGRLQRVADHIRNETFMMTYGDGVANVDLEALIRFHRGHGRLATMTAVRPPARFGGVDFDGDQVSNFNEKSQTNGGWINGGFFILEPGVLDYINDDTTAWEGEPLERLAADGQLMAYRHEGFWQCMDTLRDRRLLEDLWSRSQAPWAVWNRESLVLPSEEIEHVTASFGNR